jgi:hypothetical protein
MKSAILDLSAMILTLNKHIVLTPGPPGWLINKPCSSKRGFNSSTMDDSPSD